MFLSTYGADVASVYSILFALQKFSSISVSTEYLEHMGVRVEGSGEKLSGLHNRMKFSL